MPFSDLPLCHRRAQDHQYAHAYNNRRNKGKEEIIGDKMGYHRAYDTQHHRADHSAWCPARHKRTRDSTDDEPDNDCDNYVQLTKLLADPIIGTHYA